MGNQGGGEGMGNNEWRITNSEWRIANEESARKDFNSFLTINSQNSISALLFQEIKGLFIKKV